MPPYQIPTQLDITQLSGARRRVGEFIEHPRVQRFILGLILINAATLGFETMPDLSLSQKAIFHTVDMVVLGVFVFEVMMKFYAWRMKFFCSKWNIFDLVVILIAVAPHMGEFAALRAFRVVRVLRVLSVLPQQREMMQSLLRSLPAAAALVLPLLIVFYVFGVITTTIFGPVAPELFGGLGISMFTLFQLMTLEGWANEIVRPVMEIYPWSWALFIPYMVTTTFVFLNMASAIVMSVMNAERRAAQEAAQQVLHKELRSLKKELKEISRKI